MCRMTLCIFPVAGFSQQSLFAKTSLSGGALNDGTGATVVALISGVQGTLIGRSGHQCRGHLHEGHFRIDLYNYAIHGFQCSLADRWSPG
jgi:hypothetical protein